MKTIETIGVKTSEDEIVLTCYRTGIRISLERGLISKVGKNNRFGTIMYDNSVSYDVDLEDYNKLKFAPFY